MDTTVALWIAGIVVTIVAWFGKTLYTRLVNVEKQSNEIKYNYLDRFANVIDRIAVNESKVMEILTEIKEAIAEMKGNNSSK